MKATCQCSQPTVIRVSPTALAKRKIMCDDCMQKFSVPESTE
ncbi:hypothetical protein [Streptomyces globosus]